MQKPKFPADYHGLSDDLVEARLREEGYNEISSAGQRGLFAIALKVVREPMFLLLVSAGAIYLLLGDVGDALMLLSFVFVVMGITIYQERKTERVLQALRDLSSPRALVIRNGAKQRIPGREVVRGDILIISEGDRVPADAVVLSANHLSVDESLLTGESVPVRKSAWDGVLEEARPGGDDLPFIYSSTLVVNGQGIAEVTGIGLQTEIGKIGRALHETGEERTPLQIQTQRLVRNLAIIGLSLCVVVVILYGLTRGDWLSGLLVGITLAMAILPEEFPVVLTVFLAIGAWRISKHHVLTRHVPAIEALGSATVLCVDKTGTLTENIMTVAELYSGGEFHRINHSVPAALPEQFHEVIEYGILASQIEPFDPMEKAFKQAGRHYLLDTEHLHDDWQLVHEYDLSSKLLALSHVWRAPGRDEYVVAAKGAPEAIADLCHFNAGQLEDLSKTIALMANRGLRVLGIARGTYMGVALPTVQHDFDFEFLGLAGLADPVRPAVPDALAECHAAGIRVAMITGDYPGTALAIAREIGITPLENMLTGDEINRLDDEALRERVRSVNIYARIVPEQKLRLVNAYKANGEIVAMTGDGVNDAPALKSAHIGVAMGGRGTDVAREAASLVLLDDDFTSIVRAVRLGRRIFANLRKAMAYILAVHVPIAGMSLLPLLFGWPMIFSPVHIAFLQLIIDPACSIVFEAEGEEGDVMRRPPRDPQQALFSSRAVCISLLQGAGVLIVLIGIYYYLGLRRDADGDTVRALVFTTMVTANIALIFTNRSWSAGILSTLSSPNRSLWWVAGGTAACLALVLTLPALRQLFHFAAVNSGDVLICVAAGLGSILWFEMLKSFYRRNGKMLA